MSVFKNVLAIAYEIGLCGNSYNSCVEFLKDSSYSKIIDSEDFAPGELIWEEYCVGYAEFESEAGIHCGEY